MTKYIDIITTKSTLSKQEAIWLLEHICQEKYSKLIGKDLTIEQSQLLNTYLNEIIHEHKPLAYIIGWVPFLNLKIKVQPPILIPRPETEEWVQKLIETFLPHKNSITKILDLGTGSGVIALSLAQAFPQAQIVAIDINPSALLLAQENANLNNIKNITFLKSNLFESLKGQKFDLIVSNPPYIPEDMQKSLMPSVTAWEDSKALFSGPKGLDIINILLEKSHEHMLFNEELPYQLVIEIDSSQYDIITKLAKMQDWSCHIQKDSFGNWRTLWCTKAKNPSK